MKRLKRVGVYNFFTSQPTCIPNVFPFFFRQFRPIRAETAARKSKIIYRTREPELCSILAQNKNENYSFYISAKAENEWVEEREEMSAAAAVGKQEDWANKKNRYSLWMASRDTSALEIYALMPSPIPRQICWLYVEGVCCKGTIWQSSMRLGSQCAFFISLASTLARVWDNIMCWWWRRWW